MALTTANLVFGICALALATGLYLWQRHHSRRTKELNTLDLAGDGDEIDVLKAIEDTFGVKIDDNEAEELTTVGHLYDAVSKKLDYQTDFDPVWALVCQIAREHSGTPDPIDKNTTFFSQLAQKRRP